MTRTYGADDDVLCPINRQMFRKLRFQMIDDTDDNPYSESQFKTLKYRPEFPERFGSIQDARAFCQQFFGWYNREHHHSGIALLTPEMLHHGRAEDVIQLRQEILRGAYARNPERFVRACPKPQHPPMAAWDKSACLDDGEREKCSLINAAGCLKIVDKFRRRHNLHRPSKA
jgi:hypothetical protein